MHGQPHACGCPGEQDEKGGKRHTAGAITDQTDMLLYASMHPGQLCPGSFREQPSARASPALLMSSKILYSMAPRMLQLS